MIFVTGIASRGEEVGLEYSIIKALEMLDHEPQCGPSAGYRTLNGRWMFCRHRVIIGLKGDQA
jgi:hypothetical protein